MLRCGFRPILRDFPIMSSLLFWSQYNYLFSVIFEDIPCATNHKNLESFRQAFLRELANFRPGASGHCFPNEFDFVSKPRAGTLNFLDCTYLFSIIWLYYEFYLYLSLLWINKVIMKLVLAKTFESPGIFEAYFSVFLPFSPVHSFLIHRLKSFCLSLN